MYLGRYVSYGWWYWRIAGTGWWVEEAREDVELSGQEKEGRREQEKEGRVVSYKTKRGLKGRYGTRSTTHRWTRCKGGHPR